jgi:hypothetical protein
VAQPSFGTGGVEDRVTELVTRNDRAFPGENGCIALGTVEKIQCPAIVEGVQVRPFIQNDRQRRARLPGLSAETGGLEDSRPEVGAAAGGFGCGPNPEIQSAGIVDVRRRQWIDRRLHGERKGARGQVGVGPLNRLRVRYRFGIVFPGCYWHDGSPYLWMGKREEKFGTSFFH